MPLAESESPSPVSDKRLYVCIEAQSQHRYTVCVRNQSGAEVFDHWAGGKVGGISAAEATGRTIAIRKALRKGGFKFVKEWRQRGKFNFVDRDGSLATVEQMLEGMGD